MSPEWPLVRLFSHAGGREVLLMLLGLLSTVVCSWASPTLYVVFGNVVNIFSAYQAGSPTPTADLSHIPLLERFCDFRRQSGGAQETDGFSASQELMFQVEFLSLLLVLVGVLYILTAFLSVFCFELSGHAQILTMKRRLFRAILRRPIAKFDVENSSGPDAGEGPEKGRLKANEFASRMGGDLRTIERGINENLSLLIYFSSSIIANMFYALYFGWKLALAIFLVTPIIAISSAVLTNIQSTFARAEMKAYGEAGAFANEIFTAIRTVFAFNGQSRALDDYRAKLEPTRKMFLKKALFNAAGNAIVWAAIYCGFALGIYYGVALCKSEPEVYSIGTIILVFWCSAAVGWNLGYAAPYLENLRVACTVSAVVHEALGDEPEEQEGAQPVVLTSAPTIEFRDVHFAYPARPMIPIFSGLNLTIRSGETLAVVGTTGSGKSSILQLLQRFYNPISGRVLLDGQDVAGMDVGSLRRQFGVVEQEPVLFDMSIADNIRLGGQERETTEVTLEDVLEAAKQANAHEFISQLPDGYQTRVGLGGAQLSGGQKQRIAIARAVLSRPRVMCLDEATSALDAQSEYLVQVALERASKHCTTIIVAHRLSTVLHADRIVVLGPKGAIVQSGTHQQLMEDDGPYRQLFESQLDSVGPSKKDSSPLFGTQELVRLRDVTRRLTVAQDPRTDPEALESDSKKPWVTGRLIGMLLGYKSISVPAILCALLFGLCIPIYAFLFGRFVAEVFATTRGPRPEDSPDLGDDYLNDTEPVHVIPLVNRSGELRQDLAGEYAVWFLVLAGYAFLSFLVQLILFAVASEKLTRRLRMETFWALLQRNISWFDRNSPGTICAQLCQDPNDIQSAVGPKCAMICQAVSTLIVSISVGFYCSWKLSIVTVWFVPIIAISSSATAAVIGDQTNKEREQNTSAASLAAEALTPAGVRTIKALHREDHFVSSYSRQLTANEGQFVRTTGRKAFSMALALATPTLAYATCFYYGGRLISDGELRVEHFLQVIEAMIFGAVVFGQACFFSSDFARARSAAGHLFSLIDWARQKSETEKQPRIGSSNFLVGYALNSCRGEIEFSSVSFAYPSRAKTQILRDFNLRIKPGTRVALVGSNGAGKSSIFRLLLRFYSPNYGKIFLDGVNIAELSCSWLRSQIALVSQEPTLFSTSIRANIAYGLNGKREPAQVSLEQVQQAACAACAHEFITQLPEQYGTHVCGSLLSGGQKQRIAIARAVIRAAPILLLDEATSAADSQTEQAIDAALERLSAGRTCLIVAHRLATIRNAHRIVYVHDGQVVEDGCHEELIKLGGRYAQMWSSQFANM